VPLDDGGGFDQHHRVQTARPQAVEPDPEQAVEGEQPKPTRPLTSKNVQLMAESEVLQLQNHPTTEAAGNYRDDETHELEHARDNTAARPKSLDFFAAFGVFSRHNDCAGKSSNLGRAVAGAGPCIC
jgi:hypothetical protein